MTPADDSDSGHASSTSPLLDHATTQKLIDQATEDLITRSDADQIAYDWTCLSPASFTGYVLWLIGIGAVFYGLVGYFVWRPQWNEQILVTRSETRENETQYPNIVIATAIGDASHGVFGWTKKCAMKTQRTGEKASDCGGALSTYDEVNVVNMILFNATASLADTTSAVGGYLEVQVSYTFDPAVTQRWFGSVFPPTFLVQFIPPENTFVNDSNTLSKIWDDGQIVSAGGNHHLALRRTSYQSINGTITDGYDLTDSFVPSTQDLSTCAVSSGGCLFTLSVSYRDRIHASVREKYRMRWKELIAAIVTLAATPISLAGLLRALWTWRRQQVLKRIREVRDQDIATYFWYSRKPKGIAVSRSQQV